MADVHESEARLAKAVLNPATFFPLSFPGLKCRGEHVISERERKHARLVPHHLIALWPRTRRTPPREKMPTLGDFILLNFKTFRFYCDSRRRSSASDTVLFMVNLTVIQWISVRLVAATNIRPENLSILLIIISERRVRLAPRSFPANKMQILCARGRESAGRNGT